jgi:hypothetical protein
MRTLVTLIAATLLVTGPAYADRVSDLEARLATLEQALASRPKDPGAYKLPTKMTFCGETVPLEDPWVRERLEKELLLVLGDRAQIALWTKRAGRVFPVIEQQAAQAGTCGDLKYLAVVESGLRPAVTSRASARGWWQFMAGTARQYGLAMSSSWDERADLASSTGAGLKYLSDLHRRFGSWPLAMAAYNTGPGRLGRAQKQQGQKNYWSLDLYTEAERYVPRILAVKTVLSNPNYYNLGLRVEDGWQPRAVGTVTLNLPEGSEVTVVAAARAAGVPSRVLRLLNPEISGNTLPSGRAVVLEVPQGRERPLHAWLKTEGKRQTTLAKAAKKAKRKKTAKRKKAKKKRRQAVARRKSKARKPKARRSYKVRRGDSLWDIAEARKVSVADLRRWNSLKRRSVITPGQRLLVSP